MMKFCDYIAKENKLKPSKNCKQLKLAILSSFTMLDLKPIMRVEAFERNFYTEIYSSGYNQYTQDILDKKSGLYQFKPDIVILALRLEEFYPEVIHNYLENMGSIEAIGKTIVDKIENLIAYIKKEMPCNVFIHNFASPMDHPGSLFDFQHQDGQINRIRQINLMVIERMRQYSGVYIIDVENIMSQLGKKNIENKKMWYVAKNPYNTSFYHSLSIEYIKYLKALYGKKKKCIVLDLDNTLWGGVIGEERLDGIQLGEDYPGVCYKEFQRGLLQLNKRGILLAINSKNNRADAMEVINGHPDMVLREKNFSCMKINWQDKATNLIEIAEELNIGLDSLVFIDDNPVECDLIKQELPQVITIQLPSKPLAVATLLRGLDLFETIQITKEDLDKVYIYQAQGARERLKKQLVNLEEYYESLQMIVKPIEVNGFLIPRAAQLTQKTNQFNLTTIRYTEEDIKGMIDRLDYYLYCIRVIDRFGDNGVVGLCIIKETESYKWEINTFLLSCRVMSRQVEHAFMAYIYNRAKEKGIKQLVGRYIPTKKNKPVEKFYDKMGFERENDAYILEVDKKSLVCPTYIKIK
jgi:FkbH-like protein